ncbi:MAG TPA: hypothetical protein DD477_12870 [Spirochaetaceae bacterium]|nr:hypothetical protein [Spirochaetaceae bacterium]HBO42090.1 hypothetical protein [Spirochaetaceae bacterium]HCQ87642.1 hypothetical protein [Spirochaetaceae bacterium]
MLLASTACNPGYLGLFASIAGENDFRVDPTAAFKAASSSSLVQFNGKYYAALSRLWERAEADGSLWTVPAATKDYLVDSLVVSGATLYAAFRDDAGLSVGVLSTVDGSTWDSAALPITLGAGHELRGLLAANNLVLAWSEKFTAAAGDIPASSVYSLHYLAGAVFTAGPADLSSGLPHSLMWDGSNYWLGTGNGLYRGLDGAALAAVTLVGAAATASDQFSSLVYDTGRYFMTSSGGKLYSATDGTTWAVSQGPANTSFTTAFVIDGLTTDSYLLLGTRTYTASSTTYEADGYWQFDISDWIAGTALTEAIRSYDPIASRTNFDTSIGNSVIVRLAAFDTIDGKKQLFACTLGNGLWSNQRVDGTWAGWRRESDR